MKIADTLTIASISKDILVAALHVKNESLTKKGFTEISNEVLSFVKDNKTDEN